MLAIAHPLHRKVLACLVTLETIFRFHHSFVNTPSVRWADSSLVPVLSFLLSFFLFSKALLCHYPFTIARKRTECEDRGKASRACTHGASQRCCFLFYLPYSTCFRQSAPTRLKWILSRPFRFSAGDVLMKGDSTIWIDQVAASSAQLRAKDWGHTPPWNKRQVKRPLIYPLPFSLIPRRPRRASVYACVRLCVRLSVCVGRALIELFMTGLIGLIEDIKITCQLCVSKLPICLTTPDKWGTP